jgi:threonine dehydratase
VHSQTGAVTTRRISLETIREAARTVYEAAVRTPMVRLDAALPAPRSDPDIFLKLETLQPIGSFKIRGAYNAVRHLTPGQLARGVWTVSAGNAAQGVALAARNVGARASVLVMDTAPAAKLRAIERLGATIVQASFDECWRAVETHTPIGCRDTSSTPSTTTGSSAAMARSAWKSSRTCPTSTR